MKEPADGSFRSHRYKKEREIPLDVQFMLRGETLTWPTARLSMEGYTADLWKEDKETEMIWKGEVMYGQTDVLQRHFSEATD
jgi:hypothetical protein